MKAIETKKLSKSYGKSRGITELDLSVEAGEFFGFIGPNGAGKSTTIRTLLGLIAPTGGSASVLGHDIVKEKTAILSKIGYLPSEINFYGGMKVADAIRYSAKLHRKDCSKVAGSLCERLDLDVTKKVDDLSLGNRKKVGIVCAVQHAPELLILDEPTSGLDPLMQHEFFEILKEQSARGATIFFSSHILSEVQAYCKSAAFIKDGRIIISDKVEKLEETGTKKVTLRGLTDADTFAGEFSEKEVHHYHADGDTGSFLYRGDIGKLLSVLAARKLTDVNITEPSLEEIFMHYYS